MKTRFQTMMVSNEAIDHQKDNFIGVLTNLFAELKQDIKAGGLKDTQIEKTVTAIQNAVHKRIGIPLSLTLTSDKTINGSVEIIALDGINTLDDNASGFVKDIWKYRLTDRRTVEIVKKIISGQYGEPTGSLDYKRAKVGGIFSKITAKMRITVSTILNLDPNHVASILLHELGHVWTYYEHLGRAMYRNMIITNTIQEILSIKGEEERFKFVLDKNNLWDFDMDEDMIRKVAKLDDDKYTKVVLGATSRYFARDVGFVMYDYNSSEVIADQFMARFGGTLPPYFFDYSSQDYFTYLENEFRARNIRLLIGSLTTMVLSFFTAGIAAFVGFIVTAFSIYDYSRLKPTITGGLFLNGDTYDVGVDRYKRVRNEMVSRLKAIKDPTIQKAALQTIKDLDQIIAKYPEPKDSFGEKIIQFFYSSYKDEKAKRLLQQTIEELLANDLFVTATQFKY